MTNQSKRMLVLSGLFPNAQGNQSMLNSLIGYEKEYSIVLLTVANLTSETYLPVDAVSKVLGKTTIFSLWPRLMQSAINRVVFFRRKRRQTEAVKKRDDGLINTAATRITRAVFFVRSLILAIGGIAFVWVYRPNIVCVYEINGMLAARVIRLFAPNTKIFGKFQGTVLGENLAREDFLGFSFTRHPLDAAAFRHAKKLDAAIMTNDGTHGKRVLEKFGMPSNCILFVPNGVDEKFIDASVALRREPASRFAHDSVLHTLSLSRLIGWKRVDRIVDAMTLMPDERRKKIHHVIIGGGSEIDCRYIEEAIAIKSLSETVDFVGGKNIEAVISALQKADLLISVYKPTNIANPVFEALAMGIPVLTIRDEALIDVLGDRAQGCFFIDEPGSENLPQVLAETLQKITFDEILEKKKKLATVPVPSWAERSSRELEFIRIPK